MENVLISYGSKQGYVVPFEDAVEINLPPIIGATISYRHKDDEMVELSEYSYYKEDIREIPLIDAIDTLDGYILKSESYKTNVDGENFLLNYADNHDILRAIDPSSGRFVWCYGSQTIWAISRRGENLLYWEDPDYHFTLARNETDTFYFIDDETAVDSNYEYDEELGCFVKEEEKYVANYGCYDHPDYSDCSNFKFGVEVEKEDEDEYYGSKTQKVYDLTGWAKETDGSLGEYGYELISPIYDLMDLTKFNLDLEKFSVLRGLINADYSGNCGGHITISSKEMTAGELFSGIRAYIPLLYSLYPSRTQQSYSQAKSIYTLGYQPEKYSGVYLKEGLKGRLLEFRIFPAIRNVSNMIWRIELLQIMLRNIGVGERDVLKQLLNKKSKLSIHIRKMYKKNGRSVDEAILDLSSRYINNSFEFNHVKINASTVPAVGLKLRR